MFKKMPEILSYVTTDRRTQIHACRHPKVYVSHIHTHTHRARLGVRCGYILLDITTATLIIVSATNHCQVKSFKRCFILPQNKLKQKAAVYPD